MKLILRKVYRKILNRGMRIFQKQLPDQIYLKIHYFVKTNKRLDLSFPKTFNEKLQWLKIYDKNPEYISLVDKYRVREFVKNKIGEEYLIDLIGVYDNFEDIDFNSLPNQFVLKCTHDSGGLVICRDKSKLDIQSAREKITKSMKKNYFYYGREWPYKHVKPRIICEKFMEDKAGNGLIDYKFMCFNGKTEYIFVCTNRNSSSGVNIDIYDKNWKLTHYQRPLHPSSGITINKPKTYIKMLEFAEMLSQGIPFLRVDFYEINGKLYFGELTFFPASGFGRFEPEDFDKLLGELLILPNYDKGASK